MLGSYDNNNNEVGMGVFWSYIFAIFALSILFDGALERINGIGEITVYRQICYGHEDINSCNSFPYKEEYKVDYQKQQVFEKTNYTSIRKDCVVFDKENWNCGKEVMSNGSYHAEWEIDQKDGKTIAKSKQIFASYYYMLKASEFLKAFKKS